MAEEVPPEYRLRLFLSADLVGSTAFKAKDGNTNLKWIKAFQKFYGEFPKLFNKKYLEACEQIAEISDGEKQNTPKIWKTIGDEILFVNRISSITHLGAYITAFSETLIEFGKNVYSDFELNTKGNAWIAAFPTPNRSIKLSMNGSDPLIGEYEILTETVEEHVDRNPNEYDFLGKGIDGGFRISKNSTVDAFTISPGLAYLLCKAKRNVDTTGFESRFVFHEGQEFKGVLKGQKYPVISIITTRDTIVDDLQNLEAQLLDRPREADFVKLAEYLDKYISHHQIERPVLRLTASSSSVQPPEHYEKYIQEWKEDLNSIKSTKSREESAAENELLQVESKTTQEDNEKASKIINDFVKNITITVHRGSSEEPSDQ